MQRLVITVLAGLLSLPAHTAPATFTIDVAQSNSDYGTSIGMGIYDLNPEHYSFYINMMGLESLGDLPNHYTTIGVNAFGDPVVSRKKLPFTFNVGYTIPVTEQLHGYLGIGLTSVSAHAQKYDSHTILSSSGYYWVDEPSKDSTGLNGNIGFIFNTNNISLNAGYNSFEKRSYIGLGWKSP